MRLAVLILPCNGTNALESELRNPREDAAPAPPAPAPPATFVVLIGYVDDADGPLRAAAARRRRARQIPKTAPSIPTAAIAATTPPMIAPVFDEPELA